MSILPFQTMIFRLQHFWAEQGAAILSPIDTFVGAGTSHPATFFGALSNQSKFVAYLQPSRRPADGRYGDNPVRLQHYYQFQVFSKPVAVTMRQDFLRSLTAAFELDPTCSDVRFVEDNWENPSLGAAGLGWEVWLNGLEVAQVTYFQQMGGIPCGAPCLELTYGLERLAMMQQECESVYELVWSEGPQGVVRYGDLFLQSEKEESQYNFHEADRTSLKEEFENIYRHCQDLLTRDEPLAFSAYLHGLRCSYLFNVLEARGVYGALERTAALLNIRKLNQEIAQTYQKHSLGSPDLDTPNT